MYFWVSITLYGPVLPVLGVCKAIWDFGIPVIWNWDFGFRVVAYGIWPIWNWDLGFDPIWNWDLGFDPIWNWDLTPFEIGILGFQDPPLHTPCTVQHIKHQIIYHIHLYRCRKYWYDMYECMPFWYVSWWKMCIGTLFDWLCKYRAWPLPSQLIRQCYLCD